ncbi:RILP-like protein homolog isoform X2 [Culicoides brevitarsis]|uniref:RILP-like protein homolog isoform X2 n=1 Tax=Culicoides brevitarsis TaxID=469753 RepID=UPI00307B4AF8
MPQYIIEHTMTNEASSLETHLNSISVVEVYDLASEIGRECERIIEEYGTASVSNLIPKVINALEKLEKLASQNERENSLLEDLNNRIQCLETEKNEKAEYRKRFEKELESIEEQWRSESRELLTLVNRLQDENRRMQKQIATTPTGIISESPSIPSPSHQTNEAQIVQSLTLQLEKHRDELKTKDREIIEQSTELDQLTVQLDRLKNAGRESRKRQKILQMQIRTLCEERADFLAQMQDQHREIVTLKQRLGIAEKENEDLICGKEEDDKPRFTTAELKEVLSERNELKHRINDLEEELAACKPFSDKNESVAFIPNEEEEDGDRPVQGPLPCDPDDAPWKKTDSDTGIRKFFRKLFSEGSTVGSGESFSRRSFSQLSKMALSSGSHGDMNM